MNPFLYRLGFIDDPQTCATKVMALKRKDDPEIKYNINLEPGSLIYLDDDTQKDWLHTNPKMPEAGPRISLSFRAIIAP